MNKTVWIINQYAGSVYHGKEYRSPAIARELTKRGYRVTIISASHSHHFKQAPEVAKTFTVKTIEGVDYLWIKQRKYNASKSFKRLLNMFQFMIKCFFLPIKQMEKPDYIIVSSPSPLPILNGIYYKKKFNAKLIFEVRDLWPLSVVELGNVSSKHPLVRFLSFIEKTAYKQSDLVISVPPEAKRYMLTQGLSEKKYMVLPNGIDPKLLKDRKAPPESIRRQIDRSEFIVGYAGALGIANNLYALIDAAEIVSKTHDDILFVLLGAGSEEKKLKAYARTKGSGNIIFPGYVAREEVHALLRYFDVCYLGLQKSPLFQHGVSPTKLFDYMAAAKPILYAVDSGNHPVEDAECGIEVRSGNPRDIAKAIIAFYTMDKKEREKLGSNGYQTLLNRYTFDTLTDTLIQKMETL